MSDRVPGGPWPRPAIIYRRAGIDRFSRKPMLVPELMGMGSPENRRGPDRHKADDSYRTPFASVGCFVPPPQVPGLRGAMLKLIPWDVWVAAVCAGAVLLISIFELRPGLFLAGAIALCIYVGVKTFTAKSE